MSTRYFPTIGVLVSGLPAVYGYPSQPPLAYHVAAEDLNGSNGHSIDQGRYHPDKKELRGIAEFKRQDTFITGTSGRTGIAFDVVTGAGVWKDSLQEKTYHTYGLYLPDGAPGTEYEVVSNAAFTNGVPDCEILLYRSGPGVSGSDSNYKAAECYTYLTFGYGTNYQYRLLLEYSRPIALQFSKDAGVTWLKAAIARRLGSLESILEGTQGTIRLRVAVDRNRNALSIEVNNGHILRYGLPRSLNWQIGSPAKMRVQSKNGAFAMHLWPSRHTQIIANVKERDLGHPVTNLQKARLVVNANGKAPAGQKTTVQVTGSGQKVGFAVTATVPDAGDGLGSELPAVLSDATLVIPGVWTTDVDGLTDFRTGSFAGKRVVEMEEFNPLTRMYRQKATVICSNAYSQMNDLVGDLAVYLAASNGGPMFQRMQGIARNPVISHFDPVRLYTMDVGDKMTLLERAIGVEVDFDRWCIYNAVRFVAEVCGIHPRFMPRLPIYVPPGTTFEAPYGPAGYDCPYPILGSGTGANAKYKYLPNVPGLAILAELVADMVAKDGFRTVPFYTGFDALGNLYFEPIDIVDRLPVWSYSDIDGSGQGAIIGMVNWQSSTDNLRTDIILQGLDANTNDLLHVQRQMPTFVKRIKGTRVPLFNRSARFVSIEQMEEAIDGMTIAASIPELTGAFRAPFQPHVHASDVVFVQDYREGISGLFVIERAMHVYGVQDTTGQSGLTDCYSDLLVRATNNYF